MKWNITLVTDFPKTPANSTTDKYRKWSLCACTIHVDCTLYWILACERMVGDIFVFILRTMGETWRSLCRSSVECTLSSFNTALSSACNSSKKS